MDADGQHPADHIPHSWPLLRPIPTLWCLACRCSGPKFRSNDCTVESSAWALRDSKFWAPESAIRCSGSGFIRRNRSSALSTRPVARAASISIPKWRCAWFGPAFRRSTCLRLAAISPKSEGGISHFRYLRDNLKLIWLHLRLVGQAALAVATNPPSQNRSLNPMRVSLNLSLSVTHLRNLHSQHVSPDASSPHLRHGCRSRSRGTRIEFQSRCRARDFCSRERPVGSRRRSILERAVRGTRQDKPIATRGSRSAAISRSAKNPWC